MRSGINCLAAALTLLSCGAFAQTPSSEAARSAVGQWELSNADRDRSCTLTLRAGGAVGPLPLEWERKCAELFPFSREIMAWRVGARDAIQLLDTKGQTVVELTEVEGGLYEGERPGEGLLFLQSMAGGATTERKPEQMAGNWAFMRANVAKPLCEITLSQTPAAQDAFALQVKPNCDQSITRFGPVAWRLDRGQLVLIPRRGDGWRFEESEPNTWRRIPEGRQPVQLVRQ